MKALKVGAVIVSVALVALVIIAPPTRLRHGGKIAFAQKSVLDKLKSPSTARFPLNNYTVKTSLPGTWGVFGYVDSQNQYGAMIRTNWLVVMKLDGSSWTLVE